LFIIAIDILSNFRRIGPELLKPVSYSVPLHTIELLLFIKF